MFPPDRTTIEHLRFSSRPVMYRTGVTEAPVSIAGTAFLVGFGRHIYLLTAAHVVKGMEAVRSLFVFPSDDAKEPLRFTRWWPVEALEGEELDHDASDISAIRIDLARVAPPDRKKSHVINLNARNPWFEMRHSSVFFLCGYPKIANSVDYIRREVSTAQFFIAGEYVRRDQHSRFMHELRIQTNPHDLVDFDGLSGSPVFSVSHLSTDPGPKFCGMALRGSAKWNIVHFLEAEAILSTLEEIEND